MALLIATAKAPDANSYRTVAGSDAYFRTSRLYAGAWDILSGTDAEDWTSTGIVAAGQVSVPVTGGSGSLAAGDKFKFANHATEYTANAFSASPLTFTPALTAGVVAGEAVIRLTANKKEKSLIWATALQDLAMEWNGSARTIEQALRWPRSGVTDLDGFWLDYDTIPLLLENTTSDLALALLERNRVKEPALLSLGISEGRIGSLSAVIDRNMVTSLIPESILAALAPLGSIRYGSGGFQSVPLRRV